jgi:hypothetical protein
VLFYLLQFESTLICLVCMRGLPKYDAAGGLKSATFICAFKNYLRKAIAVEQWPSRSETNDAFA